MRIVERLILVSGVFLFVGLVYHVGINVLVHDLSLVGAGFAAIFAQELFAFLFNTLGWYYTIRPAERRVTLGALFAMRLAGDGINYLTPSASIGGAFAKVRLLQRRIPTPDAVSSVSLSVVNQFLAQVTFILVSIPFLARQLPVQADGSLALGAFGLFVCAGMILLYLGRRREPLQRIHALLVRRNWLRRWTANRDSWRELDERTFGAFRQRPLGNALSAVFFTLGWGMGALEIYLILYFLHAPVAWPVTIAIEGLSVLVDMFFFFVPSKIGTQEGGKYFIFLLLGLRPDTGFALGLVRRLREIAWSLVGLLAFSYLEFTNRGGSLSDLAIISRPPTSGPNDRPR